MLYKYHKLVRDKIPENIQKAEKKCHYQILDEDNYKKELDKKLVEEVSEWMVEHSIEEMADVMEVIEAIQKNEKIEKVKLETIKRDKKQKKVLLIKKSI